MEKDKKEAKPNEQMKKQNVTEYGEFISSYNHWLPIDKQKEQADKLDKATKSKEKRN